MGQVGTVFLGHQSALFAWRSVRRAVAQAGPPDLLARLLFGERVRIEAGLLPDVTGVSAPAPGVTRDDLLSVRRGLPELRGWERPVDVLVGSRSGRNSHGGVRSHLATGTFPEGSFMRLASGVMLPHPALLAAQLAGALSDVGVLELLSELCGFFVLDEGSPMGVCGCPLLCSLASVRGYLERLRAHRREAGQRGVAGVAKVLGLLDLAFERAASPGEAALAMLLSLPMERGGYGLARPELNLLVRLGTPGAVLAGFEEVVSDLTWPGRLMVDYQGREAHKVRARRMSDEAKRLAVLDAGMGHLQVFSEQLRREGSMDAVARTAARFLGVRLDPSSDRRPPERSTLRRELLRPWR